jgi:hypothetical protein
MAIKILNIALYVEQKAQTCFLHASKSGLSVLIAGILNLQINRAEIASEYEKCLSLPLTEQSLGTKSNLLGFT